VREDLLHGDAIANPGNSIAVPPLRNLTGGTRRFSGPDAVAVDLAACE
jgi:hypothetical protein